MRFNKWLASGLIVLALPNLVWAQSSGQIDFDPANNTIGTGKQNDSLVDSAGSVDALTYLTGADDPVTISIRLVNSFLGFLGLISMILLLYAGITWFKARDNEEEVNRAKEIIRGALTGLILTLLAYGIAQLLFSQLITVTTKTA